MNFRQLLEYSRELFSDLKQAVAGFLPHVLGAIVEKLPLEIDSIILRRMDPSQSSSIILTTVTDGIGFLSFLGPATLLAYVSGFLVKPV